MKFFPWLWHVAIGYFLRRTRRLYFLFLLANGLRTLCKSAVGQCIVQLVQNCKAGFIGGFLTRNLVLGQEVLFYLGLEGVLVLPLNILKTAIDTSCLSKLLQVCVCARLHHFEVLLSFKARNVVNVFFAIKLLSII